MMYRKECKCNQLKSNKSQKPSTNSQPQIGVTSAVLRPTFELPWLPVSFFSAVTTATKSAKLYSRLPSNGKTKPTNYSLDNSIASLLASCAYLKIAGDKSKFLV